MKAFVIAFIITISGQGQNHDILVQRLVEFNNPGFYFDTLSECEEVLSEYGPVNIVEDYLDGLKGVTVLDVNMYPHCTPYDPDYQSFPDYPEFDIPAGL